MLSLALHRAGSGGADSGGANGAAVAVAQHDPLELDEADLFDGKAEHLGAGGDSDDDEATRAATSSGGPTTNGSSMVADSAPQLLNGVAQSGSAKSTTLNMVLEPVAEIPEGVDDAAAQLQGGGPQGGWGTAVPSRRVTQNESSGAYMIPGSLPVHPSAIIAMGSSVPINIPLLHSGRAASLAPQGAGVAAAQGGRPAAAAAEAAAFVPPHQLSQRDEYTLAMLGESPGGALKRDRLRKRTAILKSTGFLELNHTPAPHLHFTTAPMDAAAAGALDAPGRPPLGAGGTPTLARGGLAQALGAGSRTNLASSPPTAML